MEKEYPIIDGHRKHFVRIPKLVTEEVIRDLAHLDYLKVGQWIAVDVLLPTGYSHLIAPNPMTYKLCAKACEVHNRYHGWTANEVTEIISESMRNSNKEAKDDTKRRSGTKK